MKKNIFITALITITLIGCDNGYQAVQKVQSRQMENHSLDDNKNLAVLSEQYFQQLLHIHPIDALYAGDFNHNSEFVDQLSDGYLKKFHQLNVTTREYLNGFDRAKLTSSNQISFDILMRGTTQALDSEAFPNHYLPFTQFSSLMSTMAQLGSGDGAQPFSTVVEYQQFLTRLRGYINWFDSAKRRLQQGIENKVVLPRVLVLRLLPQIKAQIVADVTKSIFYQPIMNLPADFSAADKQKLVQSYGELITNALIPAYADLANFIEKKYLPFSRATDGYADLPNGRPWYQHLANGHTTTSMLVEDIHQLGLGEVKRILKEMNEVKQQVDFDGDLSQFFDHLSSDADYFFSEKQQLIDGYDNYKNRIEALLPQYFSMMPKTPYVVKAVESFREQSAAGASYNPGSPDGTRAGVFYVNTYNLKAQPKWGMMTLSLHEAAPGHHFQISIQQELTALANFQRFGGQTAFIEGWALYSEYLGIEMGLFEDPYQLFGKLSDEMLRAMRLVVDTGIHAMGWSREQAIAYMLQNSAMARSDVIAEVERYMALPGQALSYKIGQLKIIELRQRAERELGGEFDLKQFHSEVLSDGSLPLAVLERKIDAWIVRKNIKVKNESPST